MSLGSSRIASASAPPEMTTYVTHLLTRDTGDNHVPDLVLPFTRAAWKLQLFSSDEACGVSGADYCRGPNSHQLAVAHDGHSLRE